MVEKLIVTVLVTLTASLLLGFSPLVDCETESESASLGAKTNDDVMVVDSGLYPVELDSVALVFYVTAVNMSPVNYTVKPMIDKCCTHMDRNANEFDCESMTLTLDKPVFLGPGVKHNFTLMFSNLYVTDRIGECVIMLEYMQDTNVQHTLKFDTCLPSSPGYCNWVPPNLREYLFGVTVTDCQTVDQDRLRNCQPANCVLKYNGHRNYYNPIRKMCEKVPSCSKVNDDGLPAQAYVPEKNICVDLDSSLTREDFEYFSAAAMVAKEPVMIKFTRQASDYHVKCVHGIVAGGRCHCTEGWQSRYMDPAAVPMEEMTQLCDVPTEGYHLFIWGIDWDMRTDIIMTLMGALIMLILTLTCLNAYEYYLRRGGFQKKEELGRLKADIAATSSEFANGSDEVNANEDPFNGFVYNESVRSVKPVDAKANSKFISGYAVALMNHFATKDTELSLRIGDVINDLRRTEKDGILEGTCHGVVGRFPDFCVNVHESRTTLE
ncbi:uncharacterized protein LOC135488226 [Lineus longissimus]|uniref:uncharacterized protein LOC135488226 n=1 Tax=Lineus longissimus TaxID=88925 RepID=UPI00315DDE5A